MKKRIALVEDEPAIRENYRDILSRQGYDVNAYANRTQAWQAFSNRLPDLAVIDIGLDDEPEGGFELCRQLRKASEHLPIIFLTARDSELDMISGLRLGADDYLTKDTSAAHLLARIVALFRRVDAMATPSTATEAISCQALTLDMNQLSATWRDTRVDLTLTEFWITHALAKHPGHVKNRQQLMDAANVVLDDSTITSHIKRIRKKFLSTDATFNHIETVYGLGYRWLEHGKNS